MQTNFQDGSLLYAANLNNAFAAVPGIIDLVTSTSTTNAGTANAVNTVWSTAKASFTIANSALNLAQSAFVAANLATPGTIQAAFNQANSAQDLALSAFAEANGFQSVINSTFSLANSNQNLVGGAYTEANSALNLAQSAYNTANASSGGFAVSAYNQANTASNTANAAFAEANGFQSIINSAFSTANTAMGGYIEANNFQAIINSSYILTNSTSNLVVGAYANANAALALANGHQSIINSAYSTANTAMGGYAEANGFQSVINSSFIVANSALNLATSAFNRANALSGISTLTITATGGVAVGGGSIATLVSNGTFALTANAATTGAVGVVQLTDVVTSTSTTTAATPNSVNTVWTTAQAAFAKANTGGGGTTVSSANLQIANGSTLNVNNQSVFIVTSNVITFPFVDSVLSISTTSGATANAVNTVWATAQAAFSQANTSSITNPLNGTLTVNRLTSNVSINTGSIVANGSINSATIIVTNLINTNLTLSMANSGQAIVVSSANLTTLTVPNTVLSIGFRCLVTQIGTGNVKFTAAGSVTLNPRTGSNNQITGQFGSMSLFCYAANTFIVDGSIS